VGDTLVYQYRAGSLYINLTKKCDNRCVFCARSYGVTQLGPFNLLLSVDHGIEEYQYAIDSYVQRHGKPREFVFCGYGEPTIRIDLLLDLAQWIRDTLEVPRRLNTNGKAGLLYRGEYLQDLAYAVDRMNVSLNAPDAESYKRICRPKEKEEVWHHVVGFARMMDAYGVDLRCSAVADVLTPEETSALREFLRHLQIPLQLR